MKKLLVLTIGICAFGNLVAQDLGPEEIINKHLEAIGQDKIMEIQTIKLTGNMSQQGIDFTFTGYMKQPRKSKLEMEFQGITIIMALNDEKGWSINPMLGSTEPQDLPPDAVKAIMEEDRLDPALSWENPLSTWKEDGAQIELAGQEDVDGSPAYNIKVTYDDDKIVHYFVDTDRFYIVKTTSRSTMQGQVIDNELRFAEFEDLDGIIIPKKMTTLANGQVAMVMSLDQFEFNLPIDDAVFEKPVPKEN